MTVYPKRPMQHVRGDMATRIFQQACPATWIISSIQPDYGLDLRIETTRGEEVTGEEFYVQIKSVKTPNVSTTDITLTIFQRSINYWLGKLHPVMLVAVNVDKGVFWFEWLENCYQEYPNIINSDRNVALVLPSCNTVNRLERDVTEYLNKYFLKIRSDIESSFESTQLTRVLFHVSALHRLCSRMSITLQNKEIESPEQLKELFYSFYLEFGIHDEFLADMWDDYIAAKSQSRLRDLLRSRIVGYSELREKFFMRKHRVQNGDFYIVPIRYSDLIQHLLPLLLLLGEIEEILLQALLLGKIIFPKVTLE